MDPERYQRIQELFWEAIELPEDDRKTFLDQIRIDPQSSELADEIESLLSEHNEEAVEREGENARAVSLPSAFGTAGDGTKVMQRGAGGPEEPSDQSDSQQTIGGAQRTYAAPRSPQAGRPRRGLPSRNAGASRVLTSVGGSPSHRTWIPIWLTLFTLIALPAWLAAWRFAHGTNLQERDALISKLGLVLANAQLEVSQQLESDLQRVEETVDKMADGSEQGSWKLRKTDAIQVRWNPQFRIDAIVGLDGQEASQDSLGQRISPDFAALLAQSLAGQPAFFGPHDWRCLLAGHHEFDATPVCGWFVPDRNSADNHEQPMTAILVCFEDTFRKLDERLAELSKRYQLDLYLVDRQGVMQSNSPFAASWLIRENESPQNKPKPVVGRLRVDEFSPEPSAVNATSGSTRPLTVAAAAIDAHENANHLNTAYESYHGVQCLGSRVWMPKFELGLIAEARIDSFSSTWQTVLPIGIASTLLAILLASSVAWWHASQLNRLSGQRQPLGRYKIIRELGSGGMGMVYQAKHLDLGKDIALKLLRSDRQDDDDRQRFDREARLAATLANPHSVTVYDYGYSDDGDAFCVMELLDGLTLSEIVARSGPQPIGRVIWIMQQVCQSMLEAHAKGLLHRDLKPQNVMLRLDPVVGDWATVFDFGLAKPIVPEKDMFQTAETIWAGTPMYMAPERFRDPSSVDPRSDIYSIGCIAYYLLAGKPPFAECDPESMFALIMTQRPLELETHLGQSIDHRVDAWVRGCMAKDKSERLASVEQLCEELLEISVSYSWTLPDARDWWTTYAEDRTGNQEN